MLTIRPETMERLQRARDEELAGRLTERCRTLLASKPVGRASGDTRALVAAALAGGRRHGLTTELEFALYLDLVVTFGAEFDRDPALAWVPAILDDTSLPTTVRINRLYDVAIVRQHEAGRRAAPRSKKRV